MDNSYQQLSHVKKYPTVNLSKTKEQVIKVYIKILTVKLSWIHIIQHMWSILKTQLHLFKVFLQGVACIPVRIKEMYIPLYNRKQYVWWLIQNELNSYKVIIVISLLEEVRVPISLIQQEVYIELRIRNDYVNLN